MKNLYPLLLGALITATNSSSLLAQNEYDQDKDRLQEIGKPLTDNVTANCNRLLFKLACSDEVQGVDGAQNLSVQQYSIVRAPERRSNSLEEVEFKKKSSGNSFDCYVMMDPAELKSIEEGVESLGEGLGVFRKTEAEAKAGLRSKTEGHLHETKGTVTDHAISSGEGESSGGEGVFSLTSESEEINKSLSQVSECLTKAAKANDEGKQEIAALWTKGAECMQASAEYDKKTAEASASNNREDQERFKNASHYFSSSALQLKQAIHALEKSTQAEIANQGELAALWIKTSKENQESAEYFSKTVNACLNGKIADTTRWENVANFCKSSADQLELAGEALEKAINAIALSRQSVATCCNRLARQHQELAECYHQASNAWSTGNTTERTCFRSASFSADASANRLKEASIILEKAIQSMEADQEELAASWLKTVEQYQELAEYHFQATNAAISKNIADRKRFYREDRYYQPDTMDSAEQLQEATIALGKAVQAKESGQGDVAELWIKIASQYQDLARYYSQVAYAWSSENCSDSYHFHEAKRHTEASAFQLKRASAALEKFTQVKESNQEVSEQWRKIVEQYQESAGHYYQAANGRFNNNNTDCNHFRQAGDFAKDHVTRLEKVAIALEKAIQTRESNQKETIALRNEVVQHYKESIEYQRQAEDAFLSG
ncbi:MAG TPA: hypothetical protein VJK54_05850, partial [Chthoniobacterales bacterium]|nr:hypothetical protein [Chthoniobacterales bacterium]